MPIVYTLIARGNVVLAEFAATTGNFVMVTRRILDKIPREDARMTYEYDGFMFHYVVASQIVALCIAEQSFSRRQAFSFLQDVHSRFEKAFGAQVQSALAYSMNEQFSRVLKRQMEYFSNVPADRIQEIKGEIDEVKGVMVSNIEKVIDRGDKIDLLVGKTEVLNQQAHKFKKNTGTLRRAMWWHNFRIQCMILLAVSLLLYMVIGGVCGFTFQDC